MKACIIILKALFSVSTAKLALEWYYIVGPVFGCIVIFAVGWCIWKRRIAGIDKYFFLSLVSFLLCYSDFVLRTEMMLIYHTII